MSTSMQRQSRTRHSHWKAGCAERCMSGLEGGCPEKARVHAKWTRDLAGQPTLQGRTTGRMSDNRDEVLEAMHALNVIRAAALSVTESVAFIRSIRETSYEQ